jgi:hypothetical protein
VQARACDRRIVVVYHGPGRPFLRGHVGDVAVLNGGRAGASIS